MSGYIPNPGEWLVVSDEDINGDDSAKTIDEMYARSNHAFRCPDSGHLFIFWEGLGGAMSIYQPPTVSGES
ncbi:hypothetical protein D5S17_07625 [Pseudonocardiaceae bacterium YIM PH 21723]|nr:hypothetical protein D5S17_07625 [Pseudonocardiaceae bacterium YIM PH 21723]